MLGALVASGSVLPVAALGWAVSEFAESATGAVNNVISIKKAFDDLNAQKYMLSNSFTNTYIQSSAQLGIMRTQKGMQGKKNLNFDTMTELVQAIRNNQQYKR